MLSDARKVGWKRQFLTAGDSEVGKTDGLKGPKRRRRLTSHTGDNARRRSAVRDAFPASRKLHDRNRVALVPCLLSPHHPPPHRHSGDHLTRNHLILNAVSRSDGSHKSLILQHLSPRIVPHAYKQQQTHNKLRAKKEERFENRRIALNVSIAAPISPLSRCATEYFDYLLKYFLRKRKEKRKKHKKREPTILHHESIHGIISIHYCCYCCCEQIYVLNGSAI